MARTNLAARTQSDRSESAAETPQRTGLSMLAHRMRICAAAGTATIARRDVDVRRLPWVRRLASEYAERFRTVAEFFAGDPWSPAGWRDAIARVYAHRHDTNGVADVLLAQAQRRAAPPASIDAIHQLR